MELTREPGAVSNVDTANTLISPARVQSAGVLVRDTTAIHDSHQSDGWDQATFWQWQSEVDFWPQPVAAARAGELTQASS